MSRTNRLALFVYLNCLTALNGFARGGFFQEKAVPGGSTTIVGMRCAKEAYDLSAGLAVRYCGDMPQGLANTGDGEPCNRRRLYAAKPNIWQK